jgi:hypothetical protein
METHFSEQDSLATITAMINRARNQLTENGHLYLMWGWVILVCSAGQFVLQHLVHYNRYYLVWLLVGPAVIYQFVYLRRESRRTAVRTYADEMLGYIWTVFAICTALLIWLVGRLLPSPAHLTPIWLIMYGMPTFLSGALLRYRGLMMGAICCWLLAVCTLFVPVYYHPLLLSAAVVCGWILPGYGMQQKFRTQNQPIISL